MAAVSAEETARERWRLILGRHSHDRIADCGHAVCQRRGMALTFLYDREYADRGVRPDTFQPGEESSRPDGRQEDPPPGGSGPSVPNVVGWLAEVRELFPRSTLEVVERHALDRYGLTELVTDPEALAGLTPNQELVATLLLLREHLAPEVLGEARRIIRQVVEELRRRLVQEVRRAVVGRRNPHRHTPVATSADFDPLGTIRASLRYWDPDREQLAWCEPKFFERNTRRLPWEIVLLLDQSGSMADSVIHSAVMAGILAELPTFRLRLVAFDTSVVDLTDQVEDPVELLLSVQLGGGTDIGRAVRYASQLIENPSRAVVVLVTDFAEGGPVPELVAAVRRLAEQRVTMIGLAALGSEAEPAYDKRVAGLLADEGMQIAALTPDALAQWLAEVTAR